MFETKISLSLLVPGAGMLSSQECEENPKESYDENKLLIKYTKGKGKYQKVVKKLIVFKTRKQRMVTQHINICDEAYRAMIVTPTSAKLARPIKFDRFGIPIRRVWDTLSVHERLKKHFDLIAQDFGASSYSYEILDD